MNCCYKIALYNSEAEKRQYVSVCGVGELEVTYKVGMWSWQPEAAGPYPLLGYSRFSAAVEDYNGLVSYLTYCEPKTSWRVALFFCEGMYSVPVPQNKSRAQRAEEYKGAATGRITIGTQDLVGLDSRGGGFPDFTVGFNAVKPVELLADGGRRVNIEEEE